jgi:hypothetical protein
MYDQFGNLKAGAATSMPAPQVAPQGQYPRYAAATPQQQQAFRQRYQNPLQRLAGNYQGVPRGAPGGNPAPRPMTPQYAQPNLSANARPMPTSNAMVAPTNAPTSDAQIAPTNSTVAPTYYR